MYEKHLNFRTIIIIFLGIIPLTFARSQCDYVKDAFAYLKGKIYEDNKNNEDCCNTNNISCFNNYYGIEEMEIIIREYDLPDADFENAIKELSNIEELTSLQIISNNLPNGVNIPESINNLKI